MAKCISSVPSSVKTCSGSCTPEARSRACSAASQSENSTARWKGVTARFTASASGSVSSLSHTWPDRLLPELLLGEHCDRRLRLFLTTFVKIVMPFARTTAGKRLPADLQRCRKRRAASPLPAGGCTNGEATAATSRAAETGGSSCLQRKTKNTCTCESLVMFAMWLGCVMSWSEQGSLEAWQGAILTLTTSGRA